MGKRKRALAQIAKAFRLYHKAPRHMVVAEAEAIEFAAHMPASYPYGLPAWIDKLYVFYISHQCQPMPRTEDVEAIQLLQQKVAAAAERIADLELENNELRNEVASVGLLWSHAKSDSVTAPKDAVSEENQLFREKVTRLGVLLANANRDLREAKRRLGENLDAVTVHRPGEVQQGSADAV